MSEINPIFKCKHCGKIITSDIPEIHICDSKDILVGEIVMVYGFAEKYINKNNGLIKVYEYEQPFFNGEKGRPIMIRDFHIYFVADEKLGIYLVHEKQCRKISGE